MSLKLGFIPYLWKVAILCMLIKPDKLPSQTTSYRPISLLSAIMKLFELVIKNVFENILKTMVSLANISQALGNPSQPMTIFSTYLSDHHGELQLGPRCKRAFDNVWHNGLRYKIYQLNLTTKLCRWLSDFLVGRVIQVKIEGFSSLKVYLKAGVPQGSSLSPLLFLSMSMTCQIQVTTRLTSHNLKMTLASGL